MTYDPTRHHRRSIRLRGYDYTLAGAYFVTLVTQDRAALFGDVVDGIMRLNDAGRMVQAVWDEIPLFYPGVDVDAFVVMPNHIHGIIVLSDDDVRPHDAGMVGADPRVRPLGDGSYRPQSGQPQSGQPQGVAPTATGVTVGADPRVRPLSAVEQQSGLPQSGQPQEGQPQGVAPTTGVTVGADPRVRPLSAVEQQSGLPQSGQPQEGQPQGVAPTATDVTVGADTGVRPDAPTPLSLGDMIARFKTLTTKRYTDGVKQLGWPPYRGRVWQRNYYEHIIRDDPSLQRIRAYIEANPEGWAADRENPAAARGDGP
jgi:REP element-mobilizing transposase RayT